MPQFLYDSTVTECHIRFVSYSTTSVLSGIIMALGFMWSMTILCRLNSVVFDDTGNRKRIIQTSRISNTFWIIYFLHVFLETSLSALRYRLSAADPRLRAYLLLMSLMLHGLAVMFLTLALDHQRRYRSADGTATVEYLWDDVSGKYRKIMKSLTSTQSVLVVLLLLYESSTFLSSNEDLYNKKWSYWLYFSMTVLQLCPTVYNIKAICWKDDQQSGGPIESSRVILCVGFLFGLAGHLPISFWNHFVWPSSRDKCFGPYSPFDFVLIGKIWWLVLVFMFVRREYIRNKEQELYDFHQECQDSVDFRRY